MKKKTPAKKANKGKEITLGKAYYKEIDKMTKIAKKNLANIKPSKDKPKPTYYYEYRSSEDGKLVTKYFAERYPSITMKIKRKRDTLREDIKRICNSDASVMRKYYSIRQLIFGKI